jgi:hypothetical protein
MVMTTEEKAAYNKAWYQANKAKIITKTKAYDKLHKEEKAEYYQAHKAEIAVKKKAYQQTPTGKKSNIFNAWKHNGLIHIYNQHTATFVNLNTRTHLISVWTTTTRQVYTGNFFVEVVIFLRDGNKKNNCIYK